MGPRIITKRLIFVLSSTILIFGAKFANGQTPPNPIAEPQNCGLTKAGLICDSSSQLSTEQRQSLAKRLESLAQNACDQCVGIAVVASLNVQGTTVQKATTDLAKSLAAGGWSFSSCKRVAIIVANVQQRFVFFQPGSGAVMCKATGQIFNENVEYFKKNDFYNGLNGMLDTYEQKFASLYKSEGDCAKDACAASTNKQTAQVSLPAVLPNPQKDSATCNSAKPAFICDPHKQISDSERQKIADQLNKFNGNNICGQCIAVALLGVVDGKVASKKATTEVSEMILNQGHWKFDNCNGLVLLLVNMPLKFVWLQGDKNARLCSQLTTIYEANKPNFGTSLQHGLEKTISGYANEFLQKHKASSDCSIDTCAQLSERQKSGAGAGNGSKGVGGHALNFAMKHKSLIIGLVVAALVIIGIGLCLGCLCCREKMMGALRSAGSAAASYGPRLGGMLKGGGRGGGGGGQATYNKGGGAGGTWDDSKPEGVALEGGGGGGWGPPGGKQPPKQTNLQPTTGGGGGAF